jgi:tetratricopeptide (TPR) repeat protein
MGEGMELLTYFIKASLQSEMQKHEMEKQKISRLSEVKRRLRIVGTDGGDEWSEVQLLIELGNVYAFYLDYELSDTMYRQAAAIAGQIPDEELETVAFANLGHSFVKRLEYEKALSYFEKALKLATKSGNVDLVHKVEAHFDEVKNMKKFDEFSNPGKE